MSSRTLLPSSLRNLAIIAAVFFVATAGFLTLLGSAGEVSAADADVTVDWAALDLKGLDGKAVDLEALKGRVVLVVNVASKCGYTGQYDGLQALYTKKRDAGLTIVGVPCNQFGGQEPGSADEIQNFCRKNYGVDFPLLAKQEVNGEARSSLYEALVGQGGDVRWNFEKFLVGRDGKVLNRYRSGVAPDSSELLAAINGAL